MPTQQIALPCKLKWPSRSELDSRSLLDLNSEPIRPALFQHVLQARMLPICSISEIPMNSQNCFRHSLQMFGGKKSNYIRQARKRLGVAVRHAHTAARQQIIPSQLALFSNDNESEIICEHINVI